MRGTKGFAMRGVFVAVLFGMLLAGCATAPSRITNACAIFEQRDGLFNNWRRDAKAAEREFGVPVPVLMATIYTESSFRPYARPPRTKLFGFIPWTRQSTAYGYAQALDGTWDVYKRETGHWGASRTNFKDAIHFVGWYHSKSRTRNGISLNDPYNLYLAYYSGHAGYEKGTWRNNAMVQRAAKRSAGIASRYEAQLRDCGY
jgi:hypothetical protein